LNKDSTPGEISSPGVSIGDLKYWLALWRVRGVGAKTYLQILQHLSPPDVFSASTDQLKKAGLSSKIIIQIKQFDWAEVEQDLAWLVNPDCHVMCWNDGDYPDLLREIPDPPPILFIRGDRSLLSSLQIALVGSRNPTPTATKTAHDFANNLASFGLTVTSGLALGIDYAAHQGALDAKGVTVAVAATGLDRVYPAKHKLLAENIITSGALVSEFPIGTRPQPGYFPRRNRIISGMSLGVLVVEAAIKSGSLVTARHAMEQGRDVFAIPGSIHNPLTKGCHHLIRQGAKLVETAEDVLEELGQMAQIGINKEPALQSESQVNKTSLGGEYDILLEKIAFDPTSVDILVQECEFTAEEISSMLLVLELQGYVLSAPGGLFYRCPI
jgi:DNA processing protein